MNFRALALAVSMMSCFNTISMATPESQDDSDLRNTFDQARGENWTEVMRFSGREPWQDHWFLDGHKATLKNLPNGLFYSAGPIARDNASHAVLWTQQSFQGDLKLEFDYTRMDTVDHYVNLIYLFATGTGEAPYVEDISQWNDLRQIPYMKMYFDHMNLLHISFAAFDNDPEATKESAYIRARRYPRSLAGGDFSKMEIEPDYSAVGLFEPGITHHITVIKRGEELLMQVQNPTESRFFRWDLSQTPNLNEGRIGLRHMNQRAAIYRNISISQAELSDQ
ncbi:hypothetical protein [Puniceicoccus vermicola]|uniref:DUF1961 family protein n=1 Tax=Puniceicoccus vermicola TaxID=388746 RepID=A0A7X1B2G1_9BACT|nr:hypothetical protein [Puniceicoccus vermicola]MBC2604403.1 hypothetical protein [Puniceicoccus vermicola]